MTDKPAPPAFQPAPRPTPRVSADVAAQLAGANADLGFTRASSPPATPAPAAAAAPAFMPAPRPSKSPAVPATTASPPARRRENRTPRLPKVAGAPAGVAALKLDIPESLWTTLRIEAVKRRITVKYLVLEALANQGYVDLAEFHEDGRRLR